MAYEKQNFRDGEYLYADQLNCMEDAIIDLEKAAAGNGLTDEQLEQVAADAAIIIKQQVPYADDIVIEDDNASYENFNFKGTVTIKANNVSIRNCLFDGYDEETKAYKQLIVDGDNAMVTDCTIYGTTDIGLEHRVPVLDENGAEVTEKVITGNNSRFTGCTFYNTVSVRGEHVQLKNIFIGGLNPGTRAGMIQGRCLHVYPSAEDIFVSDFTLYGALTQGVYFESYGGVFANFTISSCMRQGMRILSGSCQITNGKIFFCGSFDLNGDEWSGGLLAYAAAGGGMQYIPELNIQNVSIQQNFGYGVKLRKVINSNVNLSLLANMANRVSDVNKDTDKDGIAEIYVNEHGVFQRQYRYLNPKGVHYGMALYDCKNVTGIVNGVSCHTHWNGADKGYYDNVPSLNSIDVTWESCYSNNDKNHGHYKNPRLFAKFLPEVRAEIVNGLRIGNQFTEADCTNTEPIAYADIPLVADDGYYTTDADGLGSRIIPVAGEVPITGKGTVRLYVEAPELNIYPCVYLKDKDNNIIYSEEVGRFIEDTTDPNYRTEVVNLNNVMARGMRNVYSGTFCYDVGETDLTNATQFELCIHFNRTDSELTTGTVMPKIRAQFYPI